MAEFKLGRIKFVWKNAWTTATTYYVDDVVRFGGKTFICVVGHTAAASFYTDLNNVPSKWNQFTDGQDWKGNWSTPTLYKINDIVKYGGYLYVCNLSHTSQATLEADQGKWDLILEGFDWKNDWTISTTYKVNDIVKYGGNVYLCNLAHSSAGTSTLGLENDIGKWDLFNEGLDWKTDWSTSTRYKLNDVVKYGGYTYVCNTGHTSAVTATDGLETNQAYWDIFNRGIEYIGTWSGSSVRYKENDLVKYGGNIWRCNTQHTSSASFDTVKFELFVKGLEYENSWSGATVYQPGDIVSYGGNSYVAKTVHSGSTPSTGTANWDLFLTGYKLIGEWSSVVNYKVGEVVTHGGYTYVAILDNNNSVPTTALNWSRLNSGLRWRGEWSDSTSYLLGDIVSFNKFSYICVQPHTSDDDDSTITPTSNSPIKDVTGLYWNILTTGLEESVLSNPGDMVYFGTGGVTSLPIGDEGQVLTVVDGLPAWSTWGKTNQVFYVADHGEDSPAPVQGVTLDKPWASVRYATEQIEDGVLAPEASWLLKFNRTFIQKEIVEWTDYQITNNISPFTGAFTYNKSKCQRDMGLLIDAVLYDLSHGGNVKTREVAESYFTPLGASYIAGQEDETVASINYGLSLIQKVLANDTPAVNYQAQNGILLANRIKQIIDISKDSEEGSYNRCAELVDVVTDAIVAGNLNSLPSEVVPGFTINVKTGLFEEVLPILVPANTAVVGDELRSSKISPAAKLIPTNDKVKSIAALNRLRTITDEIIQNTSVTVTAGNTAVQNITGQKAGDVGSTTALNSVLANSAEIKDIIQNNTPNAYVYPNPTNWGVSLTNVAYASTGYPTGNTSGFDDARRLLIANKAFLQSEVTSWILAQIAGSVAPFVGFTYSGTRQTKCERDVGYIVDALVFDLTYGGNLATQIAARSYYSLGVFVEPAAEKAPALAVQLRIKDIIDNIVTGNTGGWTKTTVLVQDVSGTPGSADAGAFCQDRIQSVYDTINTGTEPTTIEPATSWVATALVTAKTAIQELRTTIRSDTVAYIKKTYPTLNFDETLCSRDVGYIIDALSYDLMFGSNFLSIQNGLAYQRGLESTNIVLTEQFQAQLTTIDFVGLKVSEIATSGAVVFADLLWSYIIGIITNLSLPVNTGTNTPTTNVDMINGANILRLNADFMAAEATAYINQTYKSTVSASTGGATDEFTCGAQTWMVAGDAVRFTGTVFGGISTGTTYYILSSGLTGTTFKVSLTPGGTAVDLSTAAGSMTVSYYYDQARCQNDVRRYIEAIARDMTYTGNYYSVLASRYYKNAYTGSKLEDMFYVRNGCGIRNQTLLGLDGSSDGNLTGQQDALSAPTANGTRRPNAGAYVSLDPGWGPNDQRVWVSNKSTYVQNVTTFGTGATGQKIDGALHAGGNDSIVSNDFTQVINDGVGAWVTNLGRAELVSVFTYYSHIGYLAENGGKIRATNGNNSYGTYGSVAEGVDPTEDPITAVVDNQANEASVGGVITDGSQVLQLEYFNSGINYNSATVTINGAGSTAAFVGDEIRNGGVYQVRMTDPGDSSGPGGAAYVSASNVAQTGNTVQVTLAATDTALSSAYVGTGIWLVGGTGAGQYGFITSYNSGNKQARVAKPSFNTLTAFATTTGTNLISVSSTATLYDDMPIYFSGTSFGGVTAGTLYYVRSGFTSNQFSISTAPSGGAVTLSTATGTLSIYAAGWDHVTQGTTIAATLDLTTTYEILPRITFSEPTFSKALRTGFSSTNWKSIVFGDGYGSYTNVACTGGAGLGALFNVIRRQGSYIVTTAAEGNSYVAGNTLTISGALVGGTTPANDITVTVVTIDDDTGAITSISTSGTAISQQWVAVGNDTGNAYTSPDGITWTARALPSTNAWQAVAYGAVNGIGYYVAIAYQSNQVAYSTNGTSWTSASLGVGEEWDWIDIAYGNGVFVAVAESDSSTTRRARTTDGGASWSLGNISTGAKAITYGQGRFVIVEGNFSNSAAYSADGITWTLRTLPANLDSSESDWRDIAYGNGRFVAIASNDAQVAYSIDRGVTWNAARLPEVAPWTKVSYGNGVFFAVAAGSTAASSSDGINWTTRNITATDIDILSTSRDRFEPWSASTSLGADQWNAMVYGADKYVVVTAEAGGSASAVKYSTNGVTWSTGTITGTTDDLRCIAYGDGWYVVPCAQGNDISTSQDGITFTFRNNVLTSTQDWCAIAYGGGRFVTIPFNSNISRFVTSANLTISATTVWTVGGNLTTSAEWTAMAYGSSRFVVISGDTTNSNITNYSTDGTTWIAGSMPSSDRWSAITFGGGQFVAVAGNAATTTTKAAYSTNGIAWASATLPGAAARWTNVSWNGSVFVATAYNSTRSAVSLDGITWTEGPTMTATANWKCSASNTTTYKTVVASNGGGTTNLLEYEANTNLLTVFSTAELAVGDFITVPADSAGIELFGGLATETRYYITSIYDGTRFKISTTAGGTTRVLTTGSGSMYATVNKVWSNLAYGKGGSNSGFIIVADANPAALQVNVGVAARGRPYIVGNEISEIRIHEPGSNYSSLNPPTVTITDPNNTGADATTQVRVGDGVLGQPSWTNRGIGYVSATATIVGDGVADNYQTGSFINFKSISDIPKTGSNLRITGIDDIYYKIVTIRNLTGVGPYTAQIQVSPTIGASESPEHETSTEIRARYSQVRLTGHDFLDIGTGNQANTNYPGLPVTDPIPANETVLLAGGRVFWTSTDQDGNFRVGGLFNVEQSTGTATLNAEAFNLAGLNELSLGSVALGGGGSTITEFSTDPFFTADSDAVVPTQRAIKAYISSQIGGGSGSLNVNTITAGQIYIAGNTISSTTNSIININTTVNFKGGVDGYPVALNLFLQA